MSTDIYRLTVDRWNAFIENANRFLERKSRMFGHLLHRSNWGITQIEEMSEGCCESESLKEKIKEEKRYVW